MTTSSNAPACSACGTTYPQRLAACPSCGVLTHRDELARLAERARECARSDDPNGEGQALESMLERLPPGSAQSRTLQQRLKELAGRRERGWQSFSKGGRLAGLGVLGLMIWKLKAVLLFVLTKGKVLLLGLTKTKTLFSMVFALGIYWTVWGWQFALGFILSIYVHEMGHVIALRRLGVPASAPMFIPFVGAFVRLKQNPETPAQDAEVGLAGPIYGLGAAVACYLAFQAFDASLAGALARTGAWINLFNLIPVWQLDGARGFNAMSKQQRLACLGVVAAAWFWSHDTMLLLLLLGGGFRMLTTKPPGRGTPRAAWTYAILVIALSALAQIDLVELQSAASAP